MTLSRRATLTGLAAACMVVPAAAVLSFPETSRCIGLDEGHALMERACTLYKKGQTDEAFETMHLVGRMAEPGPYFLSQACCYMSAWMYQREFAGLPVRDIWEAYYESVAARDV
jgi:hypothetical protein